MFWDIFSYIAFEMSNGVKILESLSIYAHTSMLKYLIYGVPLLFASLDTSFEYNDWKWYSCKKNQAWICHFLFQNYKTSLKSSPRYDVKTTYITTAITICRYHIGRIRARERGQFSSHKWWFVCSAHKSILHNQQLFIAAANGSSPGAELTNRELGTSVWLYFWWASWRPLT